MTSGEVRKGGTGGADGLGRAIGEVPAANDI